MSSAEIAIAALAAAIGSAGAVTALGTGSGPTGPAPPPVITAPTGPIVTAPTGPTGPAPPPAFTFGATGGTGPVFTFGSTGPVPGGFEKPRRRVSTLRRKPKTRSKNGRRSPHKSTGRRHR